MSEDKFEKKGSASSDGMTIEDSAEAAAREEVAEEAVALEKVAAEAAQPERKKKETKKKKKPIGRVLLAIVAVIVILPVIVIAVGTGPSLFLYLQGYAERDDGSYHFAKGYDYQIKKGAFTIPATFKGKPITIIDGRAFENNKKLKYLTIEEGIRQISDSAFSGCVNLETIAFPSSLKYISNQAFWGCTSLVEVVLPENLESLHSHAFSGCDNLKTVTLPKGSIILDTAFYACPSLETFICPEGGYYTFDAEHGFLMHEDYIIRYTPGNKQSEVSIPNRTRINSYAFAGADHLTAVYIPENVMVSTNAFVACSGITIYYEGDVTSSYLKEGWNPENLNVIYNYTMEE
ncbi:MAG: leucine-rich repeat domain-containing protein [Clostridia bacterium]|nr:leucine-rich repeat domain-containing protein [Clostridia bacterium]